MANTENIRKWVDALRSGKYEQGAGRLKRNDGYCCLGVACDVSGLGAWSKTGAYAAGQVRQESLPARVRDWLGLNAYLPNVKVETLAGVQELGLHSINDDWNWTFNQIADVIEATYLTDEA